MEEVMETKKIVEPETVAEFNKSADSRMSDEKSGITESSSWEYRETLRMRSVWFDWG